MNLGENIYRLRTERHMSQGDLADTLDVSRQSVSKWENGSAVPELDKLVKMSQLFGITLDELVSGSSPQPETTVPPPPQPEVKAPEPTQPEKHPLTLQEVFGIILLSLAALLTGISFIFGEYWAAAGIYFALLLATIGVACCWSTKLTVQFGMFGLDALFLFFLALEGGDLTSSAIFAVPFLIIFIILMYQYNASNE